MIVYDRTDSDRHFLTALSAVDGFLYIQLSQ